MSKAPRTWAAMLEAWGALLGECCSFLPPADADEGRRIATYTPPSGSPLHLAIWRWMWSLPPCSEARKAAFTLGHAALLIERWRSCVTMVPFRPDDGFPICEGWMVGPDDGKTTLQTSAENARALPEAQAIGHAAESLLRIAAWHVADARGERAAIDHHGAPGPTIPQHERLYRAGGEAHFEEGINFRGGIDFSSPAAGKRGAYMILHHHLGRGQRPKIEVTDQLIEVFGATAVASLPERPWVMTSRDVERFLEMILEDSGTWTRRGQDGEPARDVTEAEYAAHCQRHEPPPLGCDRHHEPGDRCGDTCALPEAGGSIAPRPGPWRRATHRTRGGTLEIRERADGRFDVRALGEQPLGWSLPDQIAERGVDAAYIRAEIMVLLP